MTTLISADADRILDTITSGDSARLARLALAICAPPGNPHTGRLDGAAAVALVRRILTAASTDNGDDVTEFCRAAAPRLTATRFHAAIRATETHGFRLLVPGDEHWPIALADLGATQPVALWATGDTALLAGPAASRIGVAGSRASTSYGEHTAHDLAYDLAQSGNTIVTGGSFGTDAAAHRAALTADAPTIAVLPAGLDRLYPLGNAALFRRIAETGLLISEAPPSTTPSRTRSVQRARIIAALCGATIIIEAAIRSGALTVAHRALSLGRIVAAVPGPITSATSTGCHQLIQHGETHVVTNADDIAELIQVPSA